MPSLPTCAEFNTKNLANTQVRPPNNRVDHTSFICSSGRNPHHHHRVGRLHGQSSKQSQSKRDSCGGHTHILTMRRSLGADAGTCCIACADSAEPEMPLSRAYSRK